MDVLPGICLIMSVDLCILYLYQYIYVCISIYEDKTKQLSIYVYIHTFGYWIFLRHTYMTRASTYHYYNLLNLEIMSSRLKSF